AEIRGHRPAGEILWTLPADSPVVRTRKDPGGHHRDGIYATPGAIGKELERAPAMTTAMIKLDPSVPDSVEHVRNTAAAIDPTMRVTNFVAVTRDRNYASAQTALMVGASVLLVLIAAPRGWGAMRVTQRRYASVMLWVEHRRASSLIGRHLTSRESAPEIRVHGAGAFLLRHFRAMAANAEAEQARLARERAGTELA
ncbi:hypothetical protein ADL27_14215, partial [Streptomyces sp. NRRL F-6602]